MAKDLPYFKFFVSEWNDGDITLETLDAQGLFINICAYYWSNECDVLVEKCIKKFKHYDQSLIKSLFDCGVLKDDNGKLVINFLDEQKHERNHKSLINGSNGKLGGRPKKPTKSENKPNALNSLSETKGNKRREEEIREEKNKEEYFIDWFNSSMESIKGSGKYKLNAKVKKQLHARIKEGYTFEDFKKAFKAMQNDSFHQANNYKHLTPEFITRVDKLEMWCNVEVKEKLTNNAHLFQA